MLKTLPQLTVATITLLAMSFAAEARLAVKTAPTKPAPKAEAPGLKTPAAPGAAAKVAPGLAIGAAASTAAANDNTGGLACSPAEFVRAVTAGLSRDEQIQFAHAVNGKLAGKITLGACGVGGLAGYPLAARKNFVSFVNEWNKNPDTNPGEVMAKVMNVSVSVGIDIVNQLANNCSIIKL